MGSDADPGFLFMAQSKAFTEYSEITCASTLPAGVFQSYNVLTTDKSWRSLWAGELREHPGGGDQHRHSGGNHHDDDGNLHDHDGNLHHHAADHPSVARGFHYYDEFHYDYDSGGAEAFPSRQRQLSQWGDSHVR